MGTIADVPIRGVCLRVQNGSGSSSRVGFFNQITVTRVPEPGAGLAGLVATAGLAGVSRRLAR